MSDDIRFRALGDVVLKISAANWPLLQLSCLEMSDAPDTSDQTVLPCLQTFIAPGKPFILESALIHSFTLTVWIWIEQKLSISNSLLLIYFSKIEIDLTIRIMGNEQRMWNIERNVGSWDVLASTKLFKILFTKNSSKTSFFCAREATFRLLCSS